MGRRCRTLAASLGTLGIALATAACSSEVTSPVEPPTTTDAPGLVQGTIDAEGTLLGGIAVELNGLGSSVPR